MADTQRRNITIDVMPTTTVRRVKATIQSKWAIPQRHQRLICGADELYDTHSLAQCNVIAGTILVVLIRGLGGGSLRSC